MLKKRMALQDDGHGDGFSDRIKFFFQWLKTLLP